MAYLRLIADRPDLKILTTGEIECTKGVLITKEKQKNLETFAHLVLEANKEINLIGKSTESIIWERHILDSLQLVNLIPRSARTFCDVGSGAGFPGIVIARLTDLNGYLVEPIKKKADFLNDALLRLGREKNLNSTRVVQDFYENTKKKIPTGVDVVTARALMPLVDLCELFFQNIKNGAIGIFPKGKSWEKELNNAQKFWKIEYFLAISTTNKESRIIIVEGLERNER